MGMVLHSGLMADYRYLFFINKYDKPTAFYWPLISFWWSFHGGLWVDHILIPLAGVLMVGAAVAWKRAAGRKLLLDPVFGASILAATGYILFMTYQNHPQPRYFALVAFFCFFIVALGMEAMLELAAGGAGRARRGGAGRGGRGHQLHDYAELRCAPRIHVSGRGHAPDAVHRQHPNGTGGWCRSAVTRSPW